MLAFPRIECPYVDLEELQEVGVDGAKAAKMPYLLGKFGPINYRLGRLRRRRAVDPQVLHSESDAGVA
jgi:hypothetical protein